MGKGTQRRTRPPVIGLAAIWLAFSLVALLAACGSGSGAGSTPTVTGQVLAGEQPAVDVLVLALNLAGRPAGEARTDAQGRFSLSLPPGTYTLAAEAGPGTMGLPAPEVVTVADGGDPVAVTLRYAMLSSLPDLPSE